MGPYPSEVLDDRPALRAPLPDPDAAPGSMVVTMDGGERIHYLDWGAPATDPGVALPPLLLVHGIAGSGWIWAPVARRLCGLTRVLAPDLRGHGLSDAPRSGYSMASLAYDVLTVASANGWGAAVGGPRVVVAGHGAGAMVAATAGALEPAGVAGAALVDGGWETLADATRMSSAEYLAALAEPPEVLASMDAFLADRRGYDPASWDADQERAARAQVDQKHAGHVAPVIRGAALRGMVAGMDAYLPAEAMGNLRCPVVVLVAESGTPDDDEIRERRLALADIEHLRAAAGMPAARVVRYPGVGHNLMRYRSAEVAGELLALLVEAAR
jgi:pimeloyl-ACP methyl ester carboxylesterase